MRGLLVSADRTMFASAQSAIESRFLGRTAAASAVKIHRSPSLSAGSGGFGGVGVVSGAGVVSGVSVIASLSAC